MFVKNDPIVVLVSKPREVDSLLECRMSVWMKRAPAGVRFLRDGR